MELMNTLDSLLPELRSLLPASLRGEYLDGYLRRERTRMELLLSRSMPNVNVEASTFEDVLSEIRALEMPQWVANRYLAEAEQALAVGQDTREVVARAKAWMATRIAGTASPSADDRRYHVVVINERTGEKQIVSRPEEPLTHAEGVTFLSKMSDYPWRRKQLEEVGAEEQCHVCSETGQKSCTACGTEIVPYGAHGLACPKCAEQEIQAIDQGQNFTHGGSHITTTLHDVFEPDEPRSSAAKAAAMEPIDRFMAAYEPALYEALRKHPEEFAYTADEVPGFLPRWRQALLTEDFNHDGYAMRGACKRLGIKCTKQALIAFLRPKTPLLPSPDEMPSRWMSGDHVVGPNGENGTIVRLEDRGEYGWHLKLDRPPGAHWLSAAGFRRVSEQSHEPPPVPPESPESPLYQQDRHSVDVLYRLVAALSEVFIITLIRSGHGYRVVDLRSKSTDGVFTGLPRNTYLTTVSLRHSGPSLIIGDKAYLVQATREAGLSHDQYRAIRQFVAETVERLTDEAQGKAPPEPEVAEDNEVTTKTFAPRMPTKYLRDFFGEKDIPEVHWTLRDSSGMEHHISNLVVVEHITQVNKDEAEGIGNMLRKLDFENRDINGYLRHLAHALIEHKVSSVQDSDEPAEVSAREQHRREILSLGLSFEREKQALSALDRAFVNGHDMEEVMRWARRPEPTREEPPPPAPPRPASPQHADPAKIADRVRKLLALAERAGTPEEAGTAYAQAQKLIAQHAISEEQLRQSRLGASTRSNEPIVSRIIYTSPVPQMPTWIGVLGMCLSETNGCEMAQTRGPNKAVVLKAWGRASDLEIVEELIRVIPGQVDALCNRSPFSGRTAKNNFRIGAVTVICERMRAAVKDARRAIQEDISEHSTATTALALASLDNRGALAKAQMRRDIPNLTMKSTRMRGDAASFEAGKAAGAALGLSRQRAIK